MRTCREVKQLYQEASCCGGNQDGLVDLQVPSECEWVESKIETTLPEHVLSRPGTSHTLEDGRTIYLQSLIDQDNADAHGLVVAWDWTQPNSLLWVADVTDRLLLDVEGFSVAYAGFYYYWSHSNAQTPYVWNNTVYTMSSGFPMGATPTGQYFGVQQWVASLDLLTGRVLNAAPSWPMDYFLATRGAAHVIESVTGEATLVLPALTLNYQLVNSYESYMPSELDALEQDLSNKTYMHLYSDYPPNPKVNLANTGCGHLIGLDTVTLEQKWVQKSCADAYKVGDVLGDEAFAPGVQYQTVEIKIEPGFVFESQVDANGVVATTVFTQTMWHTRNLTWVDVEIPEGFVWPVHGTSLATVSSGIVNAGDLRNWIQKRLYRGYTFPTTANGAIEAAWMSEAGGSFWRSNSVNIPYEGETVAVFTSGNGVNIPHAMMELYREHCDTMPNSLGKFWTAGVSWDEAKEYVVDQVKCRLDVWKTKSSTREKRNYNNAQVGVFANGSIAFVAKDEAYDVWSGGMDPGKGVAGNADGSWPRIHDGTDCDPIPGHYIEDKGVPYLVWGSKCGIRHKFNLKTHTSEIITMEGWPGRTGGNHFSDVMVHKPGKDPIIVSIYENHQSGNQFELGSNTWNEWTNMSKTHEPPFTVWTVRDDEYGFNDLPNWEGINDKYAVGVDPITLERKWITEFVHYGDTTFLQAKSDVLGVVPVRMADDITRVFDAYSGQIVYEKNSGVGSYAGWVNVNSHLFVSTFGRYDPYTTPVTQNRSSSLHLLHYKCTGDNALGAMHQTFTKTIELIANDPTTLDYAVMDVLDRRPTDDERIEFAWINNLPRVMARSAVVDRMGYAASQLNFDRTIDLSGKTYLIVGGSSGQGFQTGLLLAQMGATVHLLGRTQRIYDLSIASAQSNVMEAAEYPFYSGMRNVTPKTIDNMHFVVSDVRDLQSYRTAVESTGTNGMFDAILISAGAFKVDNATEKTYAYQMGFSSSYAEEMDAFPTRFEGATTASQFPTQVASTRHTAILLNDNVLSTPSVSIITSTAAIFDITIGFETAAKVGYLPYTFAKMEQAQDAPVYLKEQGVNNIRLHEPSGVFTSVNLAFQMGKLLKLGNEDNVPPECEAHPFSSQTAQYALGKWNETVALFGAFNASLNDEQRTHVHSLSKDGCIAYFDNFGVGRLLAGNGMTTELELALQMVRGIVYPAVNTTVHLRDGIVDDVPGYISEVYSATDDPVARALAAAYMREFRFAGSSGAKQELFKN